MERVVDINRWQNEHVKSERDMQNVYEGVLNGYRADPYPDYQQRVEMLNQLKAALLEKKQALVESLNNDYGNRSEFDSLICDLLPAVSHINYTIKHLKRWMKPSSRHAGLMLMPSKVRVEYQPLGVIGVIVPWNFPIVLSIAPIVTAIAAGNRVMVKLSEHTPHTNQVLSQVFRQLGECIFPVEGDVEVAQYFSRLPFDHLIFTGSTPVGRIVASEAAKNLTPVTLELGGKSPVIIARDADMNKAVDAVMLGKSINAGQICVAPDYVLLPEGKESEFIERYLERFAKLYVRKSEATDMTHIVNQHQWERLQALISDARNLGATIHTLDGVESASRQMLPHLVTDVDSKMRLMKEEIFGPILPIIGYAHVDEAIALINARPRPLALYLMSNDSELQQKVIEQTCSGGVAINDTLLHVAADDAPFGGVGESGMGQYHGVEGYKTFSHAKTVLQSVHWLPRSHWLLRYRTLAKKALGALFLR